MKHLKLTSVLVLGLALLLLIGVTQKSLAPYHQPPPQQSQTATFGTVLTATLTVAQETPAPQGVQGGVIGAGVFYFNPTTNVLSFAVAYRSLSGPPTAAHFHNGPPATAGGVVQTACGAPGPALLTSCPTGANGFLQGEWTVPANLVQPLLQGQLYFNIHTGANAAGEIRGQIVPL